MVIVSESSFYIYQPHEIDGMKLLRKIENLFRITHQSKAKKIPDITTIKSVINKLYNWNKRIYILPTDSKQLEQDYTTLTYINMIVNELQLPYVLQSQSITVIFILDRESIHELITTFRLTNYNEENIRFNKYGSEKFNYQIPVIKPYWLQNNSQDYQIWLDGLKDIEKVYLKILDGSEAEKARYILPLCLKTEIAITENIEKWIEIIQNKKVSPQLRKILIELSVSLIHLIPIIFDGISTN